MLSLLSPLIVYCQSGEKDKFAEALANCDKSYSILEKINKNLNFDNKQFKVDLSVCNISDSVKSEAIKKLLYEKSLYLERISILEDKEKVLKLQVQSLKNKNRRKWFYAAAGVIIGIFINKI